MALRHAGDTIRKRSSERDDDESSGSFYADAPVDIAPREVDLSGEGDDKTPNTLVITVIRARQIPSSALRMTPSCYVKLSSMGREAKTSVMSRTDEPVWNETFSFRAVDWASPVTLSVRDRSGIKMRFIGQVRVSAAELSTAPGMTRQRWMRLLDKHWDKKVGETELELKMALTYSKRNDPTVQLESAMREERDEAAIGIVVDQDEETEEEALVRMRELERQERERKSVMYANLKQGDYQVQVHIIEARDLKGENLSGTSDPYCLVDVLGTKKKTSTKDDTLGCVFDEILFFNFKNIGRDDLKQASINISVFDKELLLKDKLIGAYQLDCLSVYFRPNHELYRQWVAVHDHASEKDRGVQGFLLITVIVIGPRDSFLVHDREAEIMQEMLASAESQASLGSLDGGQSLVLLPPSIDLKLHFLLVKVFKAEDLPAMDAGSLLGLSGIDAYAQVGFAANTACRSSVVTVKGSVNLAPEFLDELWIPVMVPTLSRNINISIWDRDLTSRDELVGIASWDYHQVVSSTCPNGIMYPAKDTLTSERDDPPTEEDRQQERVEARWFNLYGPPLQNVNKKRAQAVMRHPDFGSTYRGRVLLSMERVESPSPSEGEKFHVKRMKEVSLSSNAEYLPKSVKYALRCALFCGVDIPQSTAFSLLSGPAKVRVTVTIGSYEIKFDPDIVSKDGRVTWEICREKWPVVLPADLTQVPDVVVTLSRQVDKDEFVSLSYTRLSAAELFSKGFSSMKPQWIALKEEETRRQTKYALEKNQSPGSILLRIGFGREEVAARQPWGDDALVFSPFHENFVHREIKVHVFQVRKLELPAGRTRTPSPFVSVRCCGQHKKTPPQFNTLDPLFYETIVFIVRTPEDLAYSPDLVIQLHDATVSTSLATPSGIMGELRIPMTKASKSVPGARAPRPNWFTLQSVHRQSTNAVDEYRGEALISVQHIDHAKPIEFLSAADLITPEYQEATLEIAALGVRKLKALSILGIQHPHLEFELTGGMFSDGSSVRKTKPSVSSNGKNANFLDYIVTKAKLPMDTLFAPQLEIKVCEYAIGGLRKNVVATCKVDLSNKLPWSSEYVPVAQQAFENPSVSTTGTIKSIEKPTQGKKPKLTKTQRLLSAAVRGQKSTTKKSEKRYEALLTNVQDEERGLASDDDNDDAVEKDLDENNNDIADDGIGIGDLDLTRVLRSSRATSTFTDVAIDIMDDPALQDEAQKDYERRYNAGKAEILSSSMGNFGGKNRGSAKALALDGVKPPSYMQGRDWWISHEYGGEELEKFLKAKALETYSLNRSVLTRPSLLKRKRIRVEVKAGVFKGLIRVTDRRKSREADANNSTLLDVERLRELQALEVRVYVLRASNLQSKDPNGYSDPYLRLKLGKEIISDRANHKKKTLNPDFFKMFSFHASLPGPSQLEIAVWDHDTFTDDLIGKTTIDLEDRWFHRDWQKIGRGHPMLAEAGGCLKPIEYRHLYTDTRTTSQGYVQLWVDILTAQQSALTPPVNIDPPTPRKFEVRVIIWRGENIVDQDQSEINDYFVKVWMEGGKTESTDVHWRCSNGKPCWNWRLKLPVEFPLRTPEFGRLHVQLWDKDVLKWNDMIGEAQLDLYKWIRRAYETNRSVSPFYELRRQRTGDLNRSATAEQNGENIVVDGEESPAKPDNIGDKDSPDDNDEDAEDDSEKATDVTFLTLNEKDSLLSGNNKPATSKKLTFSTKKLGFLSKPSAADLKKTREAKEKSEAKAALNGLLDFMGLGELPEDAEWISMFYTDREAGASMDMGRIGISVQIVPEVEAVANPVGKGQDSPNVNPYLPHPVGRFRISANPLSMLKELVGPKMCLRLTILCCCAGCILFISVFGATIMSTLTYLQAMENSRETTSGWILPPNMSFPSDFQFPH